jgi:DNA-3-methyladenine glycosylase
MFAEAGTLYCYRSHGIHTCCNIVTGAEGEAQAVLIRAIEPVCGIESMRAERPRVRRDADLANGPGKLCQAMGIELAHDGVDVCDPSAPVRLVEGPPIGTDRVARTPRVGISAGVDLPWRFVVAGSRLVSRGPRSR